MVHVLQSKEELHYHLEYAKEKLIVLDFYANWCGPCKIISPIFEALATTYKEKVIALKINVDDFGELAMEYNVTGMPTFIFIRDHIILNVIIGSNAEQLTKSFEKYVDIESVPVLEEGANVNNDENAGSQEDNQGLAPDNTTNEVPMNND